MLQYILTGLAGIALGIVGLRVWQVREADGPVQGDPADAQSRTRILLLGAGVLVLAAVAVLALRSPDPGPATSAQANPAIPEPDRRSAMSIR
jgi:cytochrome c-type biogenesis protein CcmH